MSETIIYRNNTLVLPEKLDIETAGKLFQSLENLKFQEKVTIDFSQVIKIDNAGVALIEELCSKLEQMDIEYQYIHLSEKIKSGLNIFALEHPPYQAMKAKMSFLERAGEKVYQATQVLIEFLVLVSDIFYWSILSLIGKSQHRKQSILHQSILIGSNAILIVGLMSFLIGLILALQSAAQLRQFGANIFIADLIGIAMIREMGPIMTAVMLAGRSGSSFASEIATMVVTEEIDALKMMAINPIRFIVAPKFIAISIMLPLLTIMSDVLGIFGGFLIGLFYLDLPAQAYWQRIFEIILVSDLFISLFKSLVFSWIIIVVGTYFGFNVKGGAEGVGKVTTSSVVASIFMVILADSVFSLIFYFG